MVKYMPDKIFSAASYCTSGGLICSGAAKMYTLVHGWDWNFIALASGVVIGVATFFTNLYFRRRQLQAYERALSRGVITPPGES